MTITLNGTTGITTPALDSVAPFSSADMPAGSVIQVVSVNNANAVTFTTSAEAVSGSITVGSNSKIAVIASIPHYAGAVTGAWNSSFSTRLLQNNSQVLNCEHVGTITAEDQTHQVPVVFTTGALSAGTYTFVIEVAKVTGGTHYVNRDGRASTLLLMEIAG